ncbi:hypothetical protein K6V78_11105 [Streptococcus gallolyticus]|nr:hypothetical protein [Streptococcus gallolyticus]MBY5040599.1 hypothetical protein [Streptococcus gallolyticus]
MKKWLSIPTLICLLLAVGWSVVALKKGAQQRSQIEKSTSRREDPSTNEREKSMHTTKHTQQADGSQDTTIPKTSDTQESTEESSQGHTVVTQENAVIKPTIEMTTEEVKIKMED